MEEGTPLAGSCSCGRNHYVIYAPLNPLRSLQLLFDERAEHGEPLCQFSFAAKTNPCFIGRALSLRVPISRIQSTTHAFYDDETHSAIRRVFTPGHLPYTKRHFCGFCGTQLSHWSEQPPEEADFIFVNLGSLKNESIEKLEDAGILSEANTDKDGKPATTEDRSHGAVAQARSHGREVRGNPWFEEMIEGSELGRIKRRRGGESSADGKTRVEWEVVEFEGEEGDSGGTGAPKRKLGSLNDEDVEMKTSL